MDREELDRYLAAAMGHSIMVSVTEPPDLPGFVRTVLVHQDLHVTIEWDVAHLYVDGNPEGPFGPKATGRHATIEDLIATLEAYLDQPFSAWRNFTRDPLVPTSTADWEPSHTHLEELVRTDRLPLPPSYTLDTHWRHIKQYGRYRPDVAYAEQRASCGDEDHSALSALLASGPHSLSLHRASGSNLELLLSGYTRLHITHCTYWRGPLHLPATSLRLSPIPITVEDLTYQDLRLHSLDDTFELHCEDIWIEHRDEGP